MLSSQATIGGLGLTSKFELESRRGFLRFLATSPLLAYPGLGFAQESRPISDPKDAINVFDFHEAAKETLPVAHYKGQSPRTMTWDFVKRLQDTTTMKVYIKGIVTGEDAALCVDDGIDGIVVLNHGGRAEASNRGTIECLAEITDVVQGRIPVIIDGGFRRGTDIFKALALGADAIAIGRPYLWRLSAFGQPGVEAVLTIMRAELEMVMRQAGTTSIDKITRDYMV